MKRRLAAIAGMMLALLAQTAPAHAIAQTEFDGFEIRANKVGLKSDKIQFRSSGGTGVMTEKYADSSSNSPVITWPSVSSNDTPVLAAAAQTLTNKTFTAPTIAAGALSGTFSGTPTFSGVCTFSAQPVFSIPLVASNINTGIKRQSLVVNFKGGDVLTDGVTYVVSIPMRRAGTVKAIHACAHTRIAGGTNTLAAAKKQGGTSVTLLSTATVDPTAFPTAADTAEAFTLTATGADLIYAAGDCLKFTLVCGTMTTDGQGYAITVDVENTDI